MLEGEAGRTGSIGGVTRCITPQSCIVTHESNGIDIITALILNDISPLCKYRMDLVLQLKVGTAGGTAGGADTWLRVPWGALGTVSGPCVREQVGLVGWGWRISTV